MQRSLAKAWGVTVAALVLAGACAKGNTETDDGSSTSSNVGPSSNSSSGVGGMGGAGPSSSSATTGGSGGVGVGGAGGVGGSAAFCGNGVTDAGEGCDDGNLNNNDDCPDDEANGGTCQPATCSDGFLHNMGLGQETDVDCGGISCAQCPTALLLSEVVVTPTAGEYIEIHNPTASPISLSHVYLADYNTYYEITQASSTPGATDFRIKFPAGTTIGAMSYLTVSTLTATDFNTTYASYPSFDFDPADTNAPAMEGDIGNSASLTNTDEMLVMFFWDGSSDLVKDIDYVVWGDNSDAMDKSAITVGGSTYLAETAVASQSIAPAPASGDSLNRCDSGEGAETQTGSNGYSGADETSEDLAFTWKTNPPTPGSANNCAFVSSGVFATTVFDDKLRTIDPNSGNTLAELTLSMTGVTIIGTNGLARNATTGIVYIVVNDSTDRYLGTLDTSTGIATQIGQLAEWISSIAVDATGVLYGVTGELATTPETLYTINTTNAAMTQVATLGAGSDGETLVFNPVDGFLYHYSGSPSSYVMERINLTNYAVTPVTTTSSNASFDTEKLGGSVVPSTGEMLVTDLNADLWLVSPSGSHTYLTTHLDALKGIVILP